MLLYVRNINHLRSPSQELYNIETILNQLSQQLCSISNAEKFRRKGILSVYIVE
jgi:hypothetical protein